MDRDGRESLQVATTEAEHRDSIIFIKVPAEPGGWRVDAGSVSAAALLESGDDVFITTGLATVPSGHIVIISVVYYNIPVCGILSIISICVSYSNLVVLDLVVPMLK